MIEPPHYLGINEFVEKLSAELLSAPLRAHYRSQRGLRADVRRLVDQFAGARLNPLKLAYSLRQPGDQGLSPVPMLGADFWPDLLLEVGQFPTVALDLWRVKAGEDPALKVGSALGQALIHCRHYPAVIVLILGGGGEPEKHWRDWELVADLWNRHKIKLVIRD